MKDGVDGLETPSQGLIIGGCHATLFVEVCSIDGIIIDPSTVFHIDCLQSLPIGLFKYFHNNFSRCPHSSILFGLFGEIFPAFDERGLHCLRFGLYLTPCTSEPGYIQPIPFPCTWQRCHLLPTFSEEVCGAA